RGCQVALGGPTSQARPALGSRNRWRDCHSSTAPIEARPTRAQPDNLPALGTCSPVPGAGKRVELVETSRACRGPGRETFQRMSIPRHPVRRHSRGTHTAAPLRGRNTMKYMLIMRSTEEAKTVY